MRLALVGTGQMGQAVSALTDESPHTVIARFNSDRPFLNAERSALAEVDVAVDFSLPRLAVPHLRQYCEWQLPVVMGTTGWYDELDEIQTLVAQHDASVLYAPNFSIGVAVLSRAVDRVTALMDELDDYDAFIHETHHTKKADSPSGTARMLAEQLVDGLARKSHIDPETQHDRIDPEAVHVTSTRTGTTFGEHTVGFDSPYDRISLRHRAKNRRGFAQGALRAAEWLTGKTTGLFTLEDMLDDWLNS
ncbi:MAG: 4-hydroxy-tetrahydrodipicolinate reductase [Salinibacter sp.]